MKVSAHCKWCNTELSSQHIGPCPNCGKEGKYINAYLSDGIRITDSFSWEKRRTYYEQHRFADLINLTITFGSPFLGLWIDGWVGFILGLVFGCISYALAPYVTSKIIELTKNK